MKKWSLFIFVLILLFPVTSYADLEKRIGVIYNSDILATVDGYPIESYALDGKTAIALEDLASYGFDIEYNNDHRKLYTAINMAVSPENYQPQTITRGVLGGIKGYTYATDITATVNGLGIKTYNIGGKLAACIEDLGDTMNSVNAWAGWSNYLLRYTWNAATRTIGLETMKVLPQSAKNVYAKNSSLDIDIYEQKINLVPNDLGAMKERLIGSDIVPGNTLISLNGYMNGEPVGDGFAGYAYKLNTENLTSRNAVIYLFPEYIDAVYDRIETNLTAKDTLEYLTSERFNGSPLITEGVFTSENLIIVYTSQRVRSDTAFWIHKIYPDGTYAEIDYVNGIYDYIANVAVDAQNMVLSYDRMKNGNWEHFSINL